MRTAQSLCPCLFVLAVTVSAQTAAPLPPASPQTTASALPDDPGALLRLAAQVNGLHGSDLKPWHVRATWQTLDDQGNVKDQGSWEEWWAGDKKYKVTYKSDTVDRTSYQTDHGVYLVEGTVANSWQFATVERLIRQPVVAVDFAAPMKTSRRSVDVQQGGVPMHCAIEGSLNADGTPMRMLNQRDGKYHAAEFFDCFVGDLPAVRSEWVSDGGMTVFNSLIRFQGQYLARKIRYSGAGGQETDISLGVVEPIAAVSDQDFLPPPDAKREPDAPPTRKIVLSSGLVQSLKIGGDPPQYPPAALAAHVQGTVVLRATISKEGTLTDLSVIAGPDMLQQAAIDAVRTWKYHPYLLNGAPVEVETQINVVFTLGR